MIRCLIADLVVEIPATGDMVSRCESYSYTGAETADIQIDSGLYRYSVWPRMDEIGVSYMESGRQFFTKLLCYDGMMLHSSAVIIDDKAYLFSGPCGTGKSTHTRLWQQAFGPAAQIINDDKPPLRKIDGVWYAYGAPWCGKDGINQNRKAKIAGICFLKQSNENRIRRLTRQEALTKIISQTQRRYKTVDNIDLMLKQVGQLLEDIPVFELENKPELDAARLSYATMRKAAEEMKL